MLKLKYNKYISEQNLYHLARDLNAFAAAYDPYEHMDTVADEERAIEDLAKELREPRSKEGIKNYLRSAMAESDAWEAEIRSLLARIDDLDTDII